VPGIDSEETAMQRRSIRSIVAVLAMAACAVAAPASATLASYDGWWWNEQQAGHGLNVGQQGNVLFVAWFTYDTAGAGMWLTMSGTLSNNAVSGSWYRTTGPQLGTPFDPTKVVLTPVGTGTLTFSNLHEATLAWTALGQSGTIALKRTTWSSVIRPLSGVHKGRMHLQVTGCPGGVTLNLPMNSTYTVAGDAITIVDDHKETGTRVCTMTGTLVPSGSYYSISGTYSCVANASTGTWTGTLLVRHPFLIRDEVLLIDGSSCIYNQSTVSTPAALQ
jgi:hypothetical protein